MFKRLFSWDLVGVLLSVCVQLPLAIYLGHFYDQTIFLDMGYLVSSGLNPYQSQMITVFSNPYLTGTNPVIGYPPLWPLLLGGIYRLTYNLSPNLFLYNFATKIPVIISNIALAYATKTIMQNQNMPKRAVQFAWIFLLFNPFTLLTTTAWGQFDTLLAALCVVGLYFLSKGKTATSALFLSLSFVLKPISLPLLGLPLLYAAPKNSRKSIAAALIVAATVFLLWLLPFYLTGWAAPDSSADLTSFFRMAGGMTVFNILDVTQRTANMPAGLWFLGYLWIPVLLVGYFWVYRNKSKSMVALAQSAVVLLLLFFLSRSWLSEQNVNLLFPFLLLLVGAGSLRLKSFNLLWIVALVFLVLNATVPQLFFLVYPPIIPLKTAFDVDYGTARLAARFAVTLVWFIFASGILIKIVSKNRKSLNKLSPH